MDSLREEISKVVRRISIPPAETGLQETVIRPDPREGSQIGSYRVLRRLGSGGMGRVYLALDQRLGRHVALKFLSSDLIADPSMLFRLQQEARTASALNHPNILTIHEIAEFNGEYFIASEFVEGVNLRYAMQHHALSLQVALDIAVQVASALVAAHAANVVHRDLTPGNIMLRSDGYIKVIDFGLAKNFSDKANESASLTLSGAVVGTVRYMSPEQARGDAVDRRTDLWSLGVVIYEMIANRRPFEGKTESHVVVAILDHPAPPLPDAKTLPPSLSRVIQRALAKDSSDRYQSAPEMLADLQEAYQEARSGSIARRAALARARRAVRLHRGFTAALALIAIAILFSVWWWPLNGRYNFVSPEWFNFSATQRATFEGNVRLAAISGDGKYLAYVPGEREVRLRSLDGASDVRLAHIANDCIGLTFSPDVRSLYCVLRDRKDAIGRLYRIALPAGLSGSFGIPALVLEDIDGPIAFSPDGRQFAYVRRIEHPHGNTSNSILVAPASNSANGRPIVSLTNTEIKEQLAWSPRGDQIAAIVFAQQLDRSTRAEVMLFSPSGQVLRKFSASNLRSLTFPVWLSGAPLLAFTGMPQNSKQKRLYQLFVPTGRFHEVPPGILNFDSLSATADGRALALVGSDQRSSLWVADASNQDAAHRITPDSEPIDSFTWSNDSQIVYPSARTGNLNLWRIDEHGSSQLSGSSACVEDWPASVPFTALIVYSSNCASGGDDFNLWSLNTQTGQRTLLTNGSTYDNQPAISPDGKWVFYTSWPSNVTSIWKVPVSGGTPIPVSTSQARFPAVSPDGQQLLCQVREAGESWRVAILDLATGALTKQYPQIPIDGPPRWSPDGTAIDYLGSELIPNASGFPATVDNIWRQPLDGSSPRQLTHLSENSVTSFSWSRNGDKLAYVRARPASDVVLYRSSH